MTTRPGRNDLCHCGSGKKYKRCHLDTDEAARVAAAATAAAAAASALPAADETKQADQQKASASLGARARKDLGRSITTSRRRSV